MQNYEWITFDCYGTLIDWETGITDAFVKIAKTSGVPFDRNKVLELYRKFEAEEELTYRHYREILPRVTRRICAQLGYRPADYAFLVESLPRWRPFADTNVALQRLARRHKLGILSNVDADLFQETRRHFTVPFDLVITADQVGSYKPQPRHFLEAKKKIGNARWIHAAQSFFHDVVPCHQLNIDVAWINRNNEEPKDKKIHPLFNKPHLIAFANWMEGVD